MAKGRRFFCWLVRFVFLGSAVFLSLGGPLPGILARAFPSLSPVVVIAGSIGNRHWYLTLFWVAPPLVFLILAFLRGRFFCRWFCPAGTLYTLFSRWSIKRPLLKRRVNGILFWAIMGGALAGAPLLFLADPLPTFNRLSVFWNRTYTAAALLPGLILPFFLLLGFVQPMVWCTHFCPLGYMMDLSRNLKKRNRLSVDGVKRDVVVGLAVGFPVALLAKKMPFASFLKAGAEHPIVPPGARSPTSFAGNCSRCYACVNACPTHVIRVKAAPGPRLGQLFHPVIDPEYGYCDEFCTACTEVCHSGALVRLDEEAKRHCQIGIAKVEKDACLAWDKGEYCMVCQEFCPYHAVETDESSDGIPRPVVNREVCRGCGICQNQCPAIEKGKAIFVHGQPQQGRAQDVF